jgi:hypothetical protein
MGARKRERELKIKIGGGTVGKKQIFCAITKKICFLPFWTILRTF